MKTKEKKFPVKYNKAKKKQKKKEKMKGKIEKFKQQRGN